MEQKTNDKTPAAKKAPAKVEDPIKQREIANLESRINSGEKQIEELNASLSVLRSMLAAIK